MLEFGILLLTGIASILLGLAVYIKNPSGHINKAFLFLTTSIIIWSTVNFISVHPYGLGQLTWVRLVLAASVMLNLSIFLTLLIFPSVNLARENVRKAKIVSYVSIFIALFTLTPLVFKDLKTAGETVTPIPNAGIPIFMLYTVLLLGNSIWMTIKKYLHATGRAKDQVRLILLGMAGTFGLLVITNFLFVVLFKITFFVPFGPAFTLILSGSLAYAIVKHRLFDIRATVARGLAYVFSLGSIGLVYGSFVYVITSILNQSTPLSASERSFYIGFALFTALIFPRIKFFFDRFTKRVFFRDAYEPQDLIDQLNKIFVANVELEPLLENSTRTISETLKAEFTSFIIEPTSYESTRLLGDKMPKPIKEDLKDMNALIQEAKSKVIISDYLDENAHDLKEFLDNKDIAVVAKLVTRLNSKDSGIGYLLLGPKKSGNAYTNQDIEVLNIIANELVIAAENALRFEEIQNFAKTLQEKVDVATRQLRRTNDKLKALDETKDEFISMASHQLRTPLTSVKGYLSMVLEGDVGKVSKSQQKLLDQAFVSSQRMVYLIADLLNVSRLRTGKFVIEAVPTNLADVIDGEVSQLQESAASRDLELTYKKPDKFPTLMLDETKIRQVIMNFMDNAIYYTPSGGHITAELKETDKTVEFTVTDDGIGVPKSEQHRLFSKFYRAGNAKKARPDGTGLGLFMAKKVIVVQGGALIFKSQEGKGSTFGFSFEKAKLAPPKAVSQTIKT